jgi:hypothetical protein
MILLVFLLLPSSDDSLFQVKLIQNVYSFLNLSAFNIILQVFESHLQEISSVCILDLLSHFPPVLRHDSESLKGLNSYKFKFELRPLGSEIPSCLLVINVLTPSFNHLVFEIEVHNLSSTLFFPIFAESMSPVPEEFLVSHSADLVITCLDYCSFASVFSESFQSDIHQL